MDTNQAQSSIKRLQTESAKLHTSAIVELFDIDIGSIADERGLNLQVNERIFRFHNSIKLITTDIVWGGITYVACPIQATGFELTSNGELPTPSLVMSVNEEGISLLALLKEKIKIFGDLVGAKVTRHKTFACFLDTVNFNDNNRPSNLDPNPFIETRDVYFIERKKQENKFIIEYELSSILDLENIQLPRRPIISQRCPFTYRCEGCLYEYNLRRNDDIHGETSILPTAAPPIATEDDKLITEILNIPSITELGAYISGNTYQKGQSAYITIGGVNYYFVSKVNGNSTSPPNPSNWLAEKCSKSINGCKLRWGQDGAVDVRGACDSDGNCLIKGHLPFGGFPSTERLRGNSY